MIKNKQNSHGLGLASQKNGGIISLAQPGSPNLTAVNDVHRNNFPSPDTGRESNNEVTNQDKFTYKSSNSMGMDEKLDCLTVGVKTDDTLIDKDQKQAHIQPLERGEVANSSLHGNVIVKTDESAHRKTNNQDAMVDSDVSIDGLDSDSTFSLDGSESSEGSDSSASPQVY